MINSNTQIAEQFSAGNFPACYDHFAGDIQWTMAGCEPHSGREAVIAYCDKMMKEMAGAKLNNSNVVAEGDQIVIEGFCSYTNEDGTPGQVFYCDIFLFSGGQIKSIRSYVVEKK